MIRPPATSPVPLRELVDRVEAALREADLSYGHGTDNARDEAAWLVLEALGRSPVDPVEDVDEPVDPVELAAVDELVVARIRTRQPLAYLTGRAWFAGLEFRVDRRALVPRSPLAGLIGERFSPWLRDGPVRRVLDIGTGGGCIAIACAHVFPEAHVDAADLDPEALGLARENIAMHGLQDRVHPCRADVFAGLPSERYDLIVANPPYVDRERMDALPEEYRHEPRHALAAGDSGLDIIDRILAGAGERLRPSGLLVVETGETAAAVEARWPSLPLVWPELADHEVGVFVIDADDLP